VYISVVQLCAGVKVVVRADMARAREWRVGNGEARKEKKKSTVLDKGGGARLG